MTDPSAGPARSPDQSSTVPLDLDAIEQRANAATPGPWYDSLETFERVTPVVRALRSQGPGVVATVGFRADGGPLHPVTDARLSEVRATVSFIAHAREDIPALIAEVARLEARLARYRAALEAIADRAHLHSLDLGREVYDVARAALEEPT